MLAPLLFFFFFCLHALWIASFCEDNLVIFPRKGDGQVIQSFLPAWLIKMHLLLIVSKSDFFTWVFYWQCHICKVFINFLLEKCFLPEAIDLETVISPLMELGASPPPLPPVLGPHPLSLQVWPGKKGQWHQVGHEAHIKVVMSCAWFRVLSHWRRRWVRLLKFLARRSCHSGARQMERLCLACQCSQQPRDYCR